MSETDRKFAVKKFVATWKNRGYEKGDTQTFWLSFIRDVLNTPEPEKFVLFEVPVQLKHKSFIDVFFPDTKVIVEQKSLSVDLDKSKSQSDGEILSPYEQAQRYGIGLPYSMRPRWIIVCNFNEFLIYDMELQDAPAKILLDELPEKFHAFDFLIDSTKNKIRLELELSLKAGEIVGKLYDALKSQYINPDSDAALQSLNKLCVRLVFCLYAESAGIFGKHKIFRDYLQSARNIRQDLILLFDVLNTPHDNRDPYLADELKNFPFVNGGLFADNNIEIPNFNADVKHILFDEAENFNWSGISPTIFGAVFESTLNPVTRRAGGMHYTSLENIHKVIDSLFLNDLHEEFQKIKSAPRNKKKKLLDFQLKLSQLKFFDPACGSGNFLTESYISLRRLENLVLKELLGEKILLGEFDNPVKISINQFFGIEINDFAVAVAQTALWIADLQMLFETAQIVHKNLNPLPLKTYANIFEGNALRLDWHAILPHDLNFIFGNPPFVGKTFQTAAQKDDMKFIFAATKNFGNLDYVACWYKKTADFIQNTKIECAFVSTNSVTQGEQVGILWQNLHVHINFAFRTFKWFSESIDMAAVHCVIIGFAGFSSAKKFIYDGKTKIPAQNINAYLLDAPDIFLQKRTKPLCNVPPMVFGNMANDGGNLILSESEREELLKKYPSAEKFIKPFIGAEEFINGKIRYCLWLVNATPSEIKKIPSVYERVKNVKSLREKSSRAATRKLSEVPYLFGEIRQPNTNFILVPRVTSENRKYIPIDFLSPEIISGDANLLIPDADLYLFGILTSSVHMAWTKTFCGRLKSDLRYSATIIYNNFPFCEPTAKQRQKIESTAQAILDVRQKYQIDRSIVDRSIERRQTIDPVTIDLQGASLAELYDEVLMPADLRAAHKANDKAVMAAYGFEWGMSESEIVGELIKLYENLT